MTQASVNITQQFKDGGVVPATLTGQNAVSKTYVDEQLAIRDANISAAAGAASAAQADIDAHEASTTAHPAQNITYTGLVAGAANVKQGLDNLYTRVNDIIADGDSSAEVVDARGGYPVLGDRLNATDAQLADLMYLGLASRYGVGPEIGSADATDLLNDYFAALKAKGLKYAYFDKPHIYHVSGKLTEARDLILLGNNAWIKSSILDNYWIQIINNRQHYNGKYNVAPSGVGLSTALSALRINKTCRVTIWGDSISTSGTDFINVSYNSHGSTNKWSPNGITSSDSLFYRLVDVLTTEFKDVAFNFYNRANAGTTLSQWQEDKTFNGVTKPWIEHIKDTNPDILIIAFGENNASIASAKQVMYYIDQVTSYINTNFTKKPTISWITAPRPTLALDSNWGSVGYQCGIDLAAYTTRKRGYSKGHYIIDANRVSNLKRVGVDYTSPYLETLAVTDSDIQEYLSGVYQKSGSEYTIQNAGDFMYFDVALRDFSFDFNVKFAPSSPGNENIWIAFNQLVRGSEQETVVLVMPKATSGVARIDVYYNFLDVGHYPVNDSYVADSPWDDNVYRNIRIEKREDILEIIVNGVGVYRGRLELNNLPGGILLRKGSNAGTAYTIKDFKFYAGKYRQYVPTLTESEMWGPYTNEDYSTKPLNGGNGVNHPSTIGLDQVYVPVLREWVEDLSNAQMPTVIEQQLMPMVQTPSWQTGGTTTTTSGANLRYFNAAKTDYPQVMTLQKSDGTYLKFRPDIKSFGAAVGLLAGEFAAYNVDNVTQVVYAFTGTADANRLTSYRSVLT